jgi:hypothetical protein
MHADQFIRMMPPPGVTSTGLPGTRYFSYPDHPTGVQPQHVAALEAQGWQRVEARVAHVPTSEENRARQEATERASWHKIPAGAPMARVIPPMVGSLTIEGRTYTSKNGATLDVPLGDARILACNGWLAFGRSGALESRPTNAGIGELFIETPSERVMQFDGKAWRDVRTGAPV